MGTLQRLDCREVGMKAGHPSGGHCQKELAVTGKDVSCEEMRSGRLWDIF